MNQQEIGVAVIEYDMDGQPVRAVFTPTMKIEIAKIKLKEIFPIKSPQDAEEIKEVANFVMASWFQKTNEIELADRDQYEIATEVVRCTQHVNGKVELCEIKFLLSPISVSKT